MSCTPGFETIHPTSGRAIALCNVAHRFAMSQPELIGRIYQEQIPPDPARLFDSYPTLRRMSRGENWELILEVEDRVALINPVTMFWIDPDGGRSPHFTLDVEQSLYLEFLYEPPADTKLRSLSLRLREAIDENLVSGLRITEAWRTIEQINEWLEQYTRDLEPLWINSGMLIRDPDLSPLNSATSQMELVTTFLNAFRATALQNFQQLALLAADAALVYHYGAVPISNDPWLPRWLLTIDNQTAALEPQFDVAVDFVDGVGQLDDPLLDQVYRVYGGKLRDLSLESGLLEGQSYQVLSWENADGEAIVAPVSQMIETVPPTQSTVIIASARSATLGPILTPFNLGVLY